MLKTNNKTNSCLGGPHSSFDAVFSSSNFNSNQVLHRAHLILDNYYKNGPPSITDMVPYSSYSSSKLLQPDTLDDVDTKELADFDRKNVEAESPHKS